MEDNTLKTNVSENTSTNEEKIKQGSETSICSKCGSAFDLNAGFCPYCGTPKTPPKPVCAKCGGELLENQLFCPTCGHKVGEEIKSKPKNKKMAGIKIALLIAIPVILVLAGVIAAILIVNDSKIDSISFPNKSMELLVDESATNPYKILPEKKQDKKVEWSSSNPEVATVSADGTVLAVGEGDCTITVSRGDKHDDFSVHVFSKFEGNLIKGKYQEAYEGAKDDKQKEQAFAENLAAVESAYATSVLKDPSSFVLNDVYYDSAKKRLVMKISGNNSFGAKVTNYWLFAWDSSGSKWFYFTSVSDLKKEEYNSWDDEDDKLEKAIDNLGRDYISETMLKGLKLDKSAIKRINKMFEEGKLDEVKLIKT